MTKENKCKKNGPHSLLRPIWALSTWWKWARLVWRPKQGQSTWWKWSGLVGSNWSIPKAEGMKSLTLPLPISGGLWEITFPKRYHVAINARCIQNIGQWKAKILMRLPKKLNFLQKRNKHRFKEHSRLPSFPFMLFNSLTLFLRNLNVKNASWSRTLLSLSFSNSHSSSLCSSCFLNAQI